ncbi:hypothetical protein SUGI_1084710 [Cryptomeria japonica]|uniref:uncharacterized protein LOC131859653 isoform X1 n=1 Tax=Cryptomeria japonica TaxID=3369 RepID=UPI0024149AD7|nr:uncharacterized protein LOC131859653 isoform X1 [Cryptomeria japonica]XP_059069656.1 uncharacterized protein LOC131859653 isoform X1 [Cryptomeria japonica]GLJ50935.1 hypothetical protein SUGI_1084710 [Cryptomeria japonica]
MSYVPPSRRAHSSSKPETPPLPAQRQNYKSKYPKLGVDIKYAKSSIHKWFAADENANPPDNLQLEFKPFAGESFAHLRDEKLYTISVNPHPVDDVEIDMRSLTINETHPWRYTWEKIKGDLREAFDNVENYVKMSKPSISARFGKILFHGGGFAWNGCLSSDILEKKLNGERGLQNPLRKTFDTHIPKDIFEALKERSIAGLASSTLKEKVVYVIQVEDDLNPGVVLRLTCRKKITDDKQLELKKIEQIPVRHFVADISCLDKLMDVRLMVTTEQYLTDLSEKDKESIEGIVESACIEESAKGGLHWPLGGSVRNRYKVKGAMILNVTTIVGKTWNMKFQHANRGEFIASSGRVTNEVNLKIKSITKYLRDQRQWEEDNIMNMMEEVFKWTWMEGLQ